MYTDRPPERGKGQLVEYLPPIQGRPGAFESARRKHALKCYRKISRLEAVRLFGIV